VVPSPKLVPFELTDEERRVLETDIRRWITEWNKNPRPFIWTKTADQILETLAAYCGLITDSGHLRGSIIRPLSLTWAFMRSARTR
jgi:hypothetical protein